MPQPTIDGPDPDRTEPDQTPPTSRWLLYLFFRPTAFFRHFVVEPVPVLTAIAFYLYGVAHAQERIEGRLEQRDAASAPDLWTGAGADWSAYWTLSLGLGLLSALFVFAAGGWWYGKRLEMAGAIAPERRLTRRVYAFASLVWVVPMLSLSLWSTLKFETPREALQQGAPITAVLLVALIWSVFTSYRGATTAFDVRPGPARTWFLILPIALYVAALALVIVPNLRSGDAPDIESTRQLDHEEFRVEFPGNWLLDRSDLRSGPDLSFTVEPRFTDAVVAVHLSGLGGTFEWPEDALETYRADFEERFDTTSWEPETRWGRYSGSGVSGRFAIDDTQYRVLLFAMRGDNRVIMVREMCTLDAAAEMEPGFALVRRTLFLR